MKNILFVAAVILAALIYIYRQRLYLRDPLGTVYRDEVKQSGLQVFINSEHDLLLVKDDVPGAYRILVQHWDRLPGAPVNLTCLRWTACLTNADNVPIVPIVWNGKGTYDPKVTMSDREVSFVDGDGVRVRVVLR
jgi:hypothetical protein